MTDAPDCRDCGFPHAAHVAENGGMRIMVTGGRTYGVLDPRKPLEHPRKRAERRTLRDALDALKLLPRGVTEVLHGGAKGADFLAKEWAFNNRIKATPFYAAWKDYGLRAGPIRNQEMVDSKPDLVVAFPGNEGTADAVAKARAAGIEVMVIV